MIYTILSALIFYLGASTSLLPSINFTIPVFTATHIHSQQLQSGRCSSWCQNMLRIYGCTITVFESFYGCKNWTIDSWVHILIRRKPPVVVNCGDSFCNLFISITHILSYDETWIICCVHIHPRIRIGWNRQWQAKVQTW